MPNRVHTWESRIMSFTGGNMKRDIKLKRQKSPLQQEV